jgi:hypothetical protein
MANITIAPAPLNITGPAGYPCSLLLTCVVEDINGNPIAWSSVTSPVVEVMDYYLNPTPGLVPTVTSPSSGQWLLSWTAAQTASLGIARVSSWALSATISGVPGPWVAGTITMRPDTTPGTSSAPTASLTVNVGTNNVAIAVATTGGVLDQIDGGAAGSVYLADQSIDGGNA